MEDSKKERLEAVAKMERAKGSSHKMKGIIIAVIAALFLGFFVFAITATKKKNSEPVTLSNSGWVKGNPKAAVIFTEFADFQCPACRAFEPSLKKLEEEYGDKVKIVFKHFPLKSIHPNAFAASVAAEAAGKQNKFWEFHDILYKKQAEWAGVPNPTEKFVSYAKSLTLDEEQFEKDLKDPKLQAAVNAQTDEGIRIGVSGTPSLFINGQPIEIPGNYGALKAQIDSALVPGKK